jgi:hypothetical protein
MYLLSFYKKHIITLELMPTALDSRLRGNDEKRGEIAAQTKTPALWAGVCLNN